jgi:hypothetical protein
MFEKTYRDVDEYVSLKKIMDQFDAYLRNLADDLAAAWPRNQAAARRRVILRHATKFATWQSLEADGVDNNQKISSSYHGYPPDPPGILRASTLFPEAFPAICERGPRPTNSEGWSQAGFTLAEDSGIGGFALPTKEPIALSDLCKQCHS